MTTRATIVIPLLRQKDAWIGQAVRSAVRQTASSEVIVVTSRETPPSNRSLLAELSSQHRNLRVMFRDLPRGFPQTLNFGMRAATTDRIGVLLSDDWLEPDCVAECLEHEADIVSTSHLTWHADGVTPVEGAARILSQADFMEMPSLEAQANYLTHFFLFQKNALERAGYADESVGDLPGIDDYHLIWTMLEQHSTVAVVGKWLYHYRDHAGERLTLADSEQAVRNLGKILRKHNVEEPEFSRLVAKHRRWFGRPIHAVLTEQHPETP